jgi:hypothetical protein
MSVYVQRASRVSRELATYVAGAEPAHQIPVDLRHTGPVPATTVPLARTFVRERRLAELIAEHNERCRLRTE